MDSKLNNNLSIVAKITSKNQITVPKEVRNKLNLKAQDSIKFTENKDGSFSMRKEKKKDLWTIVDEQEKKYGSISTPEIDWGEDIEVEDFD